MTPTRKPILAVLAVAVLVAAGACGSSSATRLNDPVDIATRSATSLASVQTVHLEATATGSVKTTALSGVVPMLGAFSGSIKLDGTTITGDIDIPKPAAHMTLTVPQLFGFTYEVIVVDGYQYTKNALQGDKFVKAKVQTPAVPSGAPATSFPSLDIGKTVADMKSALDKGGAKYSLVGIEQIAGKDAYHLSVAVPKDYVNAQLAGSGIAAAKNLTIDSLSIDVWVYVDSLFPAKIGATVASSSIGNVTVAVTLTKYNEPVSIQAPPDSQVATSGA